MKKKGFGPPKNQVSDLYTIKTSTTVGFGGPVNSLEPFLPRLKQPRTNTDREEIPDPQKNPTQQVFGRLSGVFLGSWDEVEGFYHIFYHETNLNLYEITFVKN